MPSSLTVMLAGVMVLIVCPGIGVPPSRSWSGTRRRLAGPDDGMATTEYAIATIAAAGFAGLLVVILRSDEVRGLLAGLVRAALTPCRRRASGLGGA